MRACMGSAPPRSRAPAYSLPPAEQVAAAALAVLRAHHTTPSLWKLWTLTLAQLRQERQTIALKPERLRRLLVADPRFEVEVHYREEPTKRALSRCPVCRASLAISKNETIFGGTVTVGHRCTRCSYWTGVRRRVPTRYRVRLAGRSAA